MSWASPGSASFNPAGADTAALCGGHASAADTARACQRGRHSRALQRARFSCGRTPRSAGADTAALSSGHALQRTQPALSGRRHSRALQRHRGCSQWRCCCVSRRCTCFEVGSPRKRSWAGSVKPSSSRRLKAHAVRFGRTLLWLTYLAAYRSLLRAGRAAAAAACPRFQTGLPGSRDGHCVLTQRSTLWQRWRLALHACVLLALPLVQHL